MKALWISFGILSLLAGFIGIFLPLIPTTPFALLAAFCFSKGSETLHLWLLNTKSFGPLIKDWETHGIIRKKVKVITTFMILILFGYTLIFVPVSNIIKMVVALTGVSVLSFILTRPSTPTSDVEKG